MSETKEVQIESESDAAVSEDCVEAAQGDLADEAPVSESETSEDAGDSVDAAETPPSAEEFNRMKEELDDVKAKNAEYEERSDRMLRTIADYENSKKRAEREKAEFFKYAVEGVIKDMILVVDNIERGIESAQESKDFDSLHEGIQLIHKQLGELLDKRDVTVIQAQGEPFDPNLHEAVMHIESEDVEENAVIEEFQRGYLLHDRVLRPSIVSVSRGKPRTKDTSPDDEGEKEEESNE